MASVSFSYRSKKDEAPLEVRLSFRTDESPNPISFYTRSRIIVEKSYWKKHTKTFKDIDLQLKQNNINRKITGLRKFVLEEFEKTPLEVINKQWFKSTIDLYYNPPQDVVREVIPDALVEYIPFYLEYRKHEIKPTSTTKYNVIKHKLERFQKELNTVFLIKDINNSFKQKFVDYYKSQSYSQNTMQRELGFIKTLCRHAKGLGVETHPHLDGLKLKKEKVPKVWLSFDELEQIEKVENLTEYLDNSRDWLIISCYTGARISDFMRFNRSMVRTEKNKEGKTVTLLEFTQVKTGNHLTIPLHPKVIKILEKRNGDFPRPISDQRYNEFIKEVCSQAKLNKKIKGKIQKDISKEEDEKSEIRVVEGVYPKHQLITSHVGRRSFATNFYGTIPTTFLINITGHTTEVSFLNYIGKSKKDLAMEISNYFE